MTNERERREKAVRSIRTARQAIVRIAAAWEAKKAVDTSPLAAPLFDIQAALAELEGADEPRPTQRRRTPRKRASG